MRTTTRTAKPTKLEDFIDEVEQARIATPLPWDITTPMETDRKGGRKEYPVQLVLWPERPWDGNTIPISTEISMCLGSQNPRRTSDAERRTFRELPSLSLCLYDGILASHQTSWGSHEK
jgi:hypothetical protein